MNSRSEALKGMNIPKLMKFFISLGSEYSFFLFYIIETIKTAPMETEDSSEKLISSLSIISLNAASQCLCFERSPESQWDFLMDSVPGSV